MYYAYEAVFDKTYATIQKERKKSFFWILKKTLKRKKNVESQAT